MILESTALTTVLGALSTVYQAYSKVKSNKERCKQLVDRCEMIADRLKPILQQQDYDVRIMLRIKELEKTYQKTAETITKVGEQSWFGSLLKTDENEGLIEDTQRALTELVSILSLETLIDVTAWQKENEAAVRKEFAHVKEEIKHLDQSFHNELANHGATLGQLSQVVNNMAARLGEPLSAGVISDEPTQEFILPQGQPRTRSWSSPVGVRPSLSSIVGDTGEASSQSVPTAGSKANRRASRMSWSNRPRPSLLAPPRSAGSEARPLVPAIRRPQSPLPSSPLAQSLSLMTQPTQPSPLSQTQTVIEAEPDPAHLDSPPPPYSAVSWEDELNAAYERIESNTSTTTQERPANSRSSTLAVRSNDTPAAIPDSPGEYHFDKPLPSPNANDVGLLKVRESLKRKDIKNFAAMKTIGQFGKINTRVLVEMWLFPKNRAFDTAVPLDCFEPTQRDKLQLIKSRSHQGSESSSPLQGPGEALPKYNHVLLLCPRDAKPAVIVIEKKQPLPQQSVKAYIIDSGEPMTLVSVRGPTKSSWLLIPYYPDMPIWKAKDYIQKYYGSVLIDSCCFAGQSSQLDDNSTLFENGIQAYDYNLSMKITPFSS